MDGVHLNNGVIANFTPAPPFLQQIFAKTVADHPGSTALVCGNEVLTYAELDARANQLAHFMRRLALDQNARVGLLLERSVHTYVALLATLKCGAAFVPLDTSFPPDRLIFIAEDAGLNLLLTTRALQTSTRDVCCRVLLLDDAPGIALESAARLNVVPRGDSLAYIIYTSGTTGRPKGVAVTQASIANFLAACTPIYNVAASDRVYQGMTLAFDFSIEEIWPTFAAGAALVAGPTDHRRLGAGLTDFLIEQKITVLCCVPTLLATIERDVPTLRTLLVGGEACPADLVERWSQPGRRMLNTYGPTETSVTATWCELLAGKPVTIGRPLPTYTVYLLDEQLRRVPDGIPGEICIGGPSVAVGYVKRPELTAERFIADVFTDTPGARLYRTGDLGRLTDEGEIEYLGRIDNQVKIRGYRIELGEIEAVLREELEVSGAVVNVASGDGYVQELIAYVTISSPADEIALRQKLHEALKRRLPAHMVPAFIEVLTDLPVLASGKADRARLPEPVSARLGVDNGADVVLPANLLEKELAAAWSRVFGHPVISVQADFFLDLGGHSLFAALMISDLRHNPALHQLSMADLYAHPTIRGLAQHISTHPAHAAAQTAPPLRHGNVRVWGCGLVQVCMLYLTLVILGAPVAWLASLRFASRLTIVSGVCAAFMMILISLVLPVLGKWLLVGRVRPGRYPLWGWFYCRWWLARKLMGLAPLDYLAGSPFLAPYLRLCGARIGKNCHLGTSKISMPDQIDIGAGTSIGYGADLVPFIVEDGWLHIAPIKIGAGAFIGTNAVVMLGAELGDGACLSEQSLAARDQVIPGGETWAGSPACRLADEAQLDEMAANPVPENWSPLLSMGFIAGFVTLEMLPWLIFIPGALIAYMAGDGNMTHLLSVFPAAILYVVTACLLVAVGKRLVMPHSRTGFAPLRSWFGLRKWFTDKLMLLSLGMTNSLYATLYTAPWLRLLGARVGRRAEVSTVANIDPDLLIIGPESFVADLAVVGAARHHRGTIALGTTELGPRCFVGNAALVPSDMRLPKGSLIGVQSVPPAVPRQERPSWIGVPELTLRGVLGVVPPQPTSPLKDGTSWLGSPAIFLPRRQLSEQFAESVTYRPRARLVVCRLAIEFFRIVLPATIMYVSFVFGVLAVRRLGNLTALELMLLLPALYWGLAAVATGLVAVLKWLIVGRYRPRVEPMWSFFVWRTELITALYENVAVPLLLRWFTGTPLIAPLLRLFGARVGPRVYLDTTYLTEFDLVQVGADAMIGSGTSLQTHLFEDRVMKMSHVKIGAGCAVGPRSVVLYDAELEAGAILDPLSLAMKGELLPAHTRWRGIPGQLID